MGGKGAGLLVAGGSPPCHPPGSPCSIPQSLDSLLRACLSDPNTGVVVHRNNGDFKRNEFSLLSKPSIRRIRPVVLSLLPVCAQRPFTLVPRAQRWLYRLWFTPYIKPTAFPGMFDGFLAYSEGSRKRMSCNLPFSGSVVCSPTSEMVPHRVSAASASPPLLSSGKAPARVVSVSFQSGVAPAGPSL